ncbi:FAD-binding domain-containing protein [Xylaria acuta]|nr:FAD-binding domain-containing protein [Xylaria acuta]
MTSDQKNILYSTVGGRLVAIHPIAEACHGDTFSTAECEYLRENWLVPSVFTLLPGEILHPWFTNQTCDTFTPSTTPCELGNYASYSIEASAKNNVHLIIKYSGHDYFGKSTGNGAPALWTHNLNQQEVVHYKSLYYTGPVLKAKSGVTGAQMAEFASKNGFRAVVGICPDVGVVGGLTQGGGISLMSGLYGLGADNHLTATPTRSADLYWVLTGAGGTYTVVVSMTTRLFKDGTTSGATLEFGIDSGRGGTLRSLIRTYGFDADVIATNDTISVFSLISASHTVTELRTPIQSLAELLGGVRKGQNDTLLQKVVAFNTSDAASYFKLYSTTLERLIAPNPLMPFALDVSALNMTNMARVATPVAANSVSAALNDTALSTMPVLEAATPGAGVHLNEGNWQSEHHILLFSY